MSEMPMQTEASFPAKEIKTLISNNVIPKSTSSSETCVAKICQLKVNRCLVESIILGMFENTVKVSIRNSPMEIQ